MNFKQLLDDYRNGKMNAEQRAAFEQLLHSMEAEQPHLHDSLVQVQPVAAEETREYLYERIKENYITEKPVGRVHLLLNPWLRYAAAIVLTAGIIAYFWKTEAKKETTVAATSKQPRTDVEPGREGAILTLADGRQLVLDSLGNGIVATQNGAKVVLSSGALTYDQNGETAGNSIYNTMHTPRGRQFQLVLPDGTKVWLNAASSIKYPIQFIGDERRVEIKGEAYFEVVKNAQMPFVVTVPQGGEVKVLGTHFNINAYDDEPAIKTTLLEGAVKVVTPAIVNRQSAMEAERAVVLKPGEQAAIAAYSPLNTHHSPLTIDHSPNLDQVMAWKNGLFNFNGYNIKAVMREIGRWYDLDIVYEAEPEPEEVMGELQRNLTLSQVMKILQKINVKYRIEGKQLIVTK
ncbi:FecR family protein [Niastella sp. OAS944]|uniref:FecR family protein n=1 Tax=Niastella sp. OAS944 TaxID=2664089 RepID=UPI003490695B|nr:ferric-dicitrate binding protein FerR (iron transport regulator) [Chitinophagaceae bacterium OAS944]